MLRVQCACGHVMYPGGVKCSICGRALSFAKDSIKEIHQIGDDPECACFSHETKVVPTQEAPVPLWNRPAWDKLQEAETEYLLANGWDMLAPDDWDEPIGRFDRTLSKGHAVNSQKRYDSIFASAMAKTEETK